MTKNSSKFFQNRDCEFYPCHENIEEINCLFCFCPWFYHCGSRPYTGCKDCTFPHRAENYKLMMEGLDNLAKRTPAVLEKPE